MTVAKTYVNPETSYASGGLDRDTGQNIPAVLWDRVISNIDYLGGTTGQNGYAGPRPNRLVNGGFEIWQRGAGAFTADGAYTADRWLMDEVGTDALSVTRESTVKAPNSLYSLAAAFTLGSGAGATQIYQQLSINANEANHDLLGKVISAAIEVDLLAGVASAVRAFIATDGTGGTTTYSSYHGNNTNLETLSVENVTVPTDATYVRFGLAFAASCTAYLDNARLNVSPVYCEFVALTPNEELARCQRYVVRLGADAAATVQHRGYASGAVAFGQPFAWPVRMAVAPTVTKAGTFQVVNCGQPSVGNSGVGGVFLTATATGAGMVQFYDGTSAEYIEAVANP